MKLQLESCLLVELKEWSGEGSGGDGGWGDDEDIGSGGYKASTDGDFGSDDFGEDADGGDDSASGGDYDF